jgi:transposase
MARYRHVDLSPRLLPVDLESQLVPGTFAHAVHHLVDDLELSAFDAHYRNDDNGAPAHSPTMLLKVVLLAYSQGLVSSRRIEQACRDNVLFISISGDAKPHFTTIADFISRSRDAITSVFGQVLSVLDGEGLIGRTMFAIDGVKLPSNASKHRSGTRAQFLAQAQKMETVARAMLDRHQLNDAGASESNTEVQALERVERMKHDAAQIRQWLNDNPNDRKGTRGTIRKSNRTDNESAKMATDKGVIQGYCGVAVVDSSHQVIIEASAHGTGAEQELLLPVIDACAAQRTLDTLITADAGYHSETNLAGLAERGIDALIADNQMRQRDERFADRAKHTQKPNALHDKSKQPKRPKPLGNEDFLIAEDMSHAVCPAGKTLPRNGKEYILGDYTAIKFKAAPATCKSCALRPQCLRKPETTPSRQVAVLTRISKDTHTQRMRERIDSPQGRAQYGERFATVEPVFGNVRYNKRLDRFTLRGRTKVDGQWKLFALVHNIEKLMNYRKAA